MRYFFNFDYVKITSNLTYEILLALWISRAREKNKNLRYTNFWEGEFLLGYWFEDNLVSYT